ncbi:sensor histidine kinase [Pseudonocardia sp.]|uniref:sensor histidine kinase n=1 Tax=Pseudonocardia sp. TaxID=60912 RepID=UPI003D0F76CF
MAEPHTLRPSGWSVATQLFALQAVIILAVLVGAGIAAYLNADTANSDAARDEVLGVARTLAADPAVLAALGTPDPAAELQPLAERIRVETQTSFVVVMSTGGIRYSHPNAALIGQHFLGTIEPATRGETVTEVFPGTLGPSVRAVVPVRDAAGDVRGLVAVGQTVSRVSAEMTRQLPILIGTTVVALLIAGAGSWFASRWLRRSTHDLGPRELSRMYEYYDAVLHAVREGLLLLDRAGRVQLMNDEARRLLALPADTVGRPVDGAGLPDALGAALATGADRTDEIFLAGDRVVVVNQAAARWAGHHLGTVVTLRDHTELRALVSELETIRGFADALSAQAHESANQMHTVVSLIELGRPEEAVEFATGRLAQTQALTDLVLGGIGEPTVAALVLGKHSEAAERGVELHVDHDVEFPAGSTDPRDLVTIVGNLLDNAIDAAAVTASTEPSAGAQRPWVRFAAEPDGSALHLEITDSGPGLADADRAFDRGWSTKAGGVGAAGVAGAVGPAGAVGIAGAAGPAGAADGVGAASAASAASAAGAVGSAGAAGAASAAGAVGSAGAVGAAGPAGAVGPAGAAEGGPGRLHGRGLGLALVAQAVRRHGGTVTARNGCSGGDFGTGGAVFTVHLPRHREEHLLPR